MVTFQLKSTSTSRLVPLSASTLFVSQAARTLFGCGTDELYEETEGRRGDRTTLPQDAQSAYIVGETAATHRLKATDIDGNKRERHQQIIDTVEDASEQVKGIFPWNW